MGSGRVIKALAVAFVVGFATPQATPDGWLVYFFWGAGLCAFVFACLAAGSAQDHEQSPPKSLAIRAVLWSVIGTDRPSARLADKMALLLFFAALSYLVGLTIGAFVAVGA